MEIRGENYCLFILQKPLRLTVRLRGEQMRRTESYYLVTGLARSERTRDLSPDQFRIKVLCRGHIFLSDVLASSKDARDPDRGSAIYTLYAKINKIEERRCQGKPPPPLPPITASNASAEKLASENLSHRSSSLCLSQRAGIKVRALLPLPFEGGGRYKRVGIGTTFTPESRSLSNG